MNLFNDPVKPPISAANAVKPACTVAILFKTPKN
jgi:hypothetical protein